MRERYVSDGQRDGAAKSQASEARDYESRALRLIDESLEQLAGELAEGKSERLEQYLSFTARFHRYSVFNQLLIFMQRPEATRVAGELAWWKLG